MGHTPRSDATPQVASLTKIAPPRYRRPRHSNEHLEFRDGRLRRGQLGLGLCSCSRSHTLAASGIFLAALHGFLLIVPLLHLLDLRPVPGRARISE